MYIVGRGRAWQTMPCHVLLHILAPRFSIQTVSRDVAGKVSQALRRGVTRSKRRAMQWWRKAAENGLARACLQLAIAMYVNSPYAREVGHVGEDAARVVVDVDVGEDVARVVTLAEVMEAHDVPADVLTGVIHWLQKGGHNAVAELDTLRREALEGAKYCSNVGCEAGAYTPPLLSST
jgi:hypothetical protein